MTPTEQDKELREKLASIEHERWADWQRWMHKKARVTDQGHLIIDREDVERWERQIATPYSDLSEKEKASDMEQVDRYWQLITADRKRVALEARVAELKTFTGISNEIPEPEILARIKELEKQLETEGEQ